MQPSLYVSANSSSLFSFSELHWLAFWLYYELEEPCLQDQVNLILLNLETPPPMD